MASPEFWKNDWTEAQRKYWENWTEMSRKAMGMDAPEKSPWEKSMEQWWLVVSPMTPDPARPFVEKMIVQGKIFYNMADVFSRHLESSETREDWDKNLAETLDRLNQAFDSETEESGEVDLQKLMAFWELPVQSWQKLAQSLAGVPTSMDQNPDDYFSAFGFGADETGQAERQEMLEKLSRYQEVASEYSRFFSRMGQLSVERLREAISKLDAEDEQINTAKGLYDLWVQVSEEVYNEEVKSPDYAKLHGELVNALMAVRQQAGGLFDKLLSSMNVPTRQDLKAVHDKLRKVQRENRALKKEIQAIKETLAKPAGKKVSQKKKTVKAKKTARKKSVTKPE